MSAHIGTAWLDVKPDLSGLNRELDAAMMPIARRAGGRFDSALGPIITKQTQNLQKFKTAAKIGGLAAAGFAVYGLDRIVESGKAFESQMDVNIAISEATRREQKLLEGQSLQLGKATFFSANEVAKAQAELIKGGLEVQQVLGGGLPAALSLAEAGELDLAIAGETLVNTMGLFDIAGKDSMHIADGLATAANKTTADVLDFAVAFKQGGSAVKQAGGDFYDGLTILEALAESGIKNSDAGTSMKAAILQLLAPTKKQLGLTEELGISFVDQNGNLKDAAALSRTLQGALDGYSNAQRVALLKTLAGTDGFRTLAALYDAGPEKLRKLEEANRKQGVAQDIARQKMDNLTGDFEQFSGSIETAELRIYKGLEPALRSLTQEATVAVDAIGEIFADPNLSGAEKVEAAIRETGDQLEIMWERNDMTDHLVETIDRAVPIVAEQAGELGWEAAKGFGRGFLRADPIGKAVMGAWALNFIGGKAAFAGVGKFFGISIGKEIATTAAVTAAAEIATASVVPSVVAGAAGAGAGRGYRPGGAWLGSGPGRKAAAGATGRALLEDAFGGFTLGAATGAAADSAAKSGVFRQATQRLGASGATNFTSGFAGSVKGALSKVKWARIGAVGLGIALADTAMSEFDRRTRENSEDLGEALKAKAEGLKVGPISLHKGNAGEFDPFGVFGANETERRFQNLSGQYDEVLEKRVRLSRATIDSLAAQAKESDLTKEQRVELERMFTVMRSGRRLGVGLDLGMDPTKLRKITADFRFLRRGVGESIGDIERVSKRGNRNIVEQFGRGTKEARELTARNMHLTANAMKIEMERSGNVTKAGMRRIKQIHRNADLTSPGKKQAREFGREWARGMDETKEVTKRGLNAILKEAERMPAPMRKLALETFLEQVRQARKSGDLTAEAYRKMRSRVLSEYSGIEVASKAFNRAVSSGYKDMANESSAAVGTLMGNTNSALGALKIEPLDYSIRKVGEQRRQDGGFIVPGKGDGDSFRTALTPGWFILNREATKAHGFNQGGLVPVALEPGEAAFSPGEVRRMGGPAVLERMNREVPRRRQDGGLVGGPRIPALTIDGPEGPLRDIGRGAIELVLDGARREVGKHAARAGGSAAGAGKHRSYPGLSGDTDFAVELGRRLSRMALATVGHISVTSGWRSYAEQAALWAANPNPAMVAPPGRSNHGRGLAADISPQKPAYGGKEGRFGLHFPMSWEPWHIEMLQFGGLVRKLAEGGGIAGASRWDQRGSTVAEMFQRQLPRIWNKAAPHYGRSPNSPHPATYVAGPKDDLDGAAGAMYRTRDLGRWVVLQRNAAKGVLGLPGGDPQGPGTLVHEWAHIFQRGGLKWWESEGGAEAFKMLAGPSMFPNRPFAFGGRTVRYEKAKQRVLREKGERWIKRGQFRQLGGLIQALAEGGWVKTGYTTYSGSGPGAHGTLPKGDAYAELGTATSSGVGTGRGLIAKALGMSGELPADFPLEVKIGSIGKVGKLYKRDRGFGQGDDWHSIDIHTSGFDNVGLSGQNKGIAFIRSADGKGGKTEIAKEVGFTEKGGSVSGGGGTYAPSAGKVSTEKLKSFGSLPDNIAACRRELNQRQNEYSQYLSARRQTKDPEERRALDANINLLRNRIRALRAQLGRLLAARWRKRTSARITRRGAFPDIEEALRIRELDHTRAQEVAEQIVALEPEENARPYIEGRERPAFEAVLGTEAGWRNTILSGQGVAAQRIAALRKQLQSIEALKGKNPKAYRKQRFRLGPIRQAIAKARESFDPARRTGSFEDALINVQGSLDFAGARDPMGSLPATPVAGMFGGLIWNTQTAIRDLALKLKQSGEDSELKDLENQERADWKKRFLVSEAYFGTISDFDRMREWVYGELPKFHSGGVVPGPPTQETPILARGQERVRTPEQEAALAGAIREGAGVGPGVTVVIERLVVHEDGRATARINGRDVEVAVERVLSGAQATGRPVPGGTRI